MSEFKLYSSGLQNVGSYQVAGVPYITGSNTLGANGEDCISFPNVTKTVTVINHTSNAIRIHFNSSSAGPIHSGFHYVELDSDEDSYTFNIKCKEIYISAPSGNSGDAEYRVVAELTHIHTGRMYDLTGSGLTD